MAKRKYLLDSDIKASHWYIDNKGFKILFLDRAEISFAEWLGVSRQHIPKASDIVKAFNCDPNLVPMNMLLEWAFNVKNSKFYTSSGGHRKLIADVGVHPDGPFYNTITNPGCWNYTFVRPKDVHEAHSL